MNIKDCISGMKEEFSRSVTVGSDYVIERLVVLEGIIEETMERRKEYSDLSEARARYKKKFGKMPFLGWKIEEVEERMKEKILVPVNVDED